MSDSIQVVPAASLPAPRRFVAYDKFLDCVHCGLCLQACPTYVELGTEMDSPRGRIYLMKGLEEGTLQMTDDVARHLDLCLGCRACETACPSGVQYGHLIESARSFVEEQHRRPFFDRLRRRMVTLVFPRPQLLRVLLLPLRLLELVGVLAAVRRVSALAAMLPRLGWWAPLPATTPADAAERQRVGLVAGCVAQVLFAETNRATVRVLTRNGCSVSTPPRQTCCGALYLHAGARQQALDCARRNIDAFPSDLSTIIVNAAGCGAMLKEYGELLADDPAYAQRAHAFSVKVRDITEFLAALSLVPPRGAVRMRVTYHDACHLAHGQGVRDAPRRLLQQIPGLELAELAESDTCCGSAGSYNVTEPEMARRLGDRKAANIRATGTTCVAAANPGCVMQIQASLQRAGVAATVLHPVELLDRAYAAETESDLEHAGLAWQTGVWNRISDIYVREIDQRFAPVVETLVARAALASGEDVLDLGTGTGAVALRTAAIVSPSGHVTAVDISPDMLAFARQRADALGLRNVRLLEGRAESIPADSGAFDVVVACLSLMYVIDREAAAREIARVLRPGGRFVAAVWAGPEQCDIVLFQQTAGRFAGPPPVPGVGPGALADPSGFLRQLATAGIEAHVETEILGFDFVDFHSAWNALAGVTTTHLSFERQDEAKNAVKAAMYPRGDRPRHFRNLTQFIVGRAVR